MKNKCPGFSQDGVNFHKKPGGDTARRPSILAKWVMQYHVMSCSLPSGGAGWGEVNHSSRECEVLGRKRIALRIPLFCIFCLLLWLLFASFAVLLKSLYPNPRALPFSSDSPPHPTEGRGDRSTTWFFVASRGQTMTVSHKVSSTALSYKANFHWICL